ncbi:MAG: phage holin family protein [Defluviitaleaceae bacterium]|nr:phage holin family protein [Defluviitaleaceae bacterium]
MFENIYVRGFYGGVIGILAYLFGGMDALMTGLIAMMGIDFATGIIKAVVMGELTSQKMFVGGVRKIGMFFIVAVANLVDGLLELGGVLRAATICYFIANEGISMLENWSLMGLPIPSRLKDVLAQLKDKGSDGK